MLDPPTLAQRVEGSPALRRHRRMAAALIHAVGRVSVAGADQVPTRGPVLLAVNHRSLLDGVLVIGCLQAGAVPRPVSFLVKAEAFRHGLGRVLEAGAQVPVVRGTVDPAPLRLCLAVLRADGVVGIFPEGARGTGLAATAKPGVGWLALRSGASVVPVAVHGTSDAAHRRTARRPEVRLAVGEPIAVERHPDDLPLNRKLSADVAEQVRRALAALVAATR